MADRPNSAQLRGDIDSGRTGDKTPGFDPAAAPLGTDEEAAGTPPSAEEISQARLHENRRSSVHHPNAAEPGLAPHGHPRRGNARWVLWLSCLVVVIAFGAMIVWNAGS